MVIDHNNIQLNNIFYKKNFEKFSYEFFLGLPIINKMG